jgi:putative ATPase
MYTPLAELMRPQSFDDIIGQTHLIGENKPLSLLLYNKPQSIILWGPPGVGKTTIANILTKSWDCQSVSLSAIFSGIKEIKEALEFATNSTKELFNKQTVIFVDEIHRFNKIQQDAFLHHMEDGRIILIGATTENPSFELNRAILSRVQTYVLNKLSEDELGNLLNVIIDKHSDDSGVSSHSDNDKLIIEPDAKNVLLTYSAGDARRLINLIETIRSANISHVTLQILKNIIPNSLVPFDKNKEEFYNHISALHKSIRGSDHDAALYWFTKMVAGGADVLYIGRRLLKVAYEDIGLADMNAPNYVLNAIQTYERLGSPEGELALANCIIYLAITPKSNSGYLAYNKVMECVKNNVSYEVPLHLRNAPTKLMKELEYGREYKYAHDFVNHYVPNENYMPDNFKKQQFYTPSNQGLEQRIKERINFLRELDKEVDKK